MKKIPCGNDIPLHWSLLRYGVSFDLTGKNVTVYLRSPNNVEKITDFTVTGNVIFWTYYGKDQKTCGKYSLILRVNEGEIGMITTFACNAFELVKCSCYAGGVDDDNIVTEPILLTSDVSIVGSSSGGGTNIVIDTVLSKVSMNPVGNKVITEALEDKVSKDELKKLQESLGEGFLKAEPQILSAEQKATVRNNLGIDDYIMAVIEGSINDAINGEY